MTVWERLDALFYEELENGADMGLKLDIATECGWGAELRYTEEPNRENAPDQSIVFYSAGQQTPEDAAKILIYEFLAWKDAR